MSPLQVNKLLPKSLFTWSKKFFDLAYKDAGLQAMSKLAFRAQTVDIAYLPLRQGFFGKKLFNDRSKGLRFGQQPVES